MGYIGLTREEKEELAKAEQVPSYDKLIHDSEKIAEEEALNMFEGMPEVFAIPDDEWDRLMGTKTGQAIKLKMITAEGTVKHWLWWDVAQELRPLQDGDQVVITADMSADLIQAALTFSGAVGAELIRQQIISYGAKYAIGKKLRFVARRMDRSRVFLCMTFDGEPEEGMWNLEIPRLAGFCFTEPDSPELSIMECPEEFLHERELVLKGIMKYYGCNEARAEAELIATEKAMSEYGICFYRP